MMSWIPIALATAAALAPPVSLDKLQKIDVGHPFPDIEDVKFKHTTSPFDKTPSGRYTVVAFFTYCKEPTARQATLLNDIADQYGPSGVDCLAITVLDGSKSKTQIRKSKLETPWAEVSSIDTGKCGFPTHCTKDTVLVDPCGRVVWIGKGDEAPGVLDDLEMMLTLPLGEQWPASRTGETVRGLFEDGKLGRALEVAREAEDESVAALAPALRSIVEGRIALLRECQEMGQLELAEMVHDQLVHQVKSSPFVEPVKELKAALKKAQREAD